MPITLKTNEIKLKDQNGNYKSPVVLADETTPQHIADVNAAITAKGQETIASIPSDYTTLSNTVDRLVTEVGEASSLDVAAYGSTALISSGGVYKTGADALGRMSLGLCTTNGGNITCAQLVPALLVEANFRKYWTVTDSGTTTEYFVGGAGRPISAGDKVCVLKNSTTQRISTASFMFKVVADTMDGLTEESSSYSDTIEQLLDDVVHLSDTPGLVKNDGTINTTIENSVAQNTAKINDLKNALSADTSTIYNETGIAKVTNIPAKMGEVGVEIMTVDLKANETIVMYFMNANPISSNMYFYLYDKNGTSMFSSVTLSANTSLVLKEYTPEQALEKATVKVTVGGSGASIASVGCIICKKPYGNISDAFNVASYEVSKVTGIAVVPNVKIFKSSYTNILKFDMYKGKTIKIKIKFKAALSSSIYIRLRDSLGNDILPSGSYGISSGSTSHVYTFTPSSDYIGAFVAYNYLANSFEEAEYFMVETYGTNEESVASVVNALNLYVDSLDTMKANKVPTLEQIETTVNSGQYINVSSFNGPSYANADARNIILTSGFSDGQVLYITGRVAGSAQYGLVGFWSDTGVLKYYAEPLNTNIYRKPFIVPVGTTQIRINGKNDALPMVEIATDYTDLEEISESIVNKAEKIPVYEKLTYTITEGELVNVSVFNGSGLSGNARYRSIIMTSGFNPGDAVYISGVVGGAAQYGLVGFWSDTSVLEYDSTPLNTKVSRRKHIIPFGTTQIRVNGNAGFLPTIEIVSSQEDLIDVDNDYIFNMNNAFDRIIAKQKQAPFVYKTFDKPIISFVFDDSLPDISTIQDIFETNNISCGYATIPEQLYVTALDGRYIKEVLIQAQENGGEILCHSWTALTSSSTDEEVKKNFVTNKKLLVDNGFDVTGIILSGGTGADTFDTKRCERYLRCYYDFSDAYGKGLNLPQFYSNNRKWLTSDDATNKAFVDDAVANNEWIILSAHGVARGTSGDIGQSALENIIAYVLSKDVYVYTPREVIEKYGGSQAAINE